MKSDRTADSDVCTELRQRTQDIEWTELEFNLLNYSLVDLSQNEQVQ